MNRPILLGVAFLATLALPPAAAQDEITTDAAVKGPVAVFVTKVHDFGEVDRGDTLEHSFRLRNDGDKPLEVLGAKPS